MHKEIEEARALIRIIQEFDESPEFVTEKATDLFNSVAALLALFDRMQQEPVVEIEHNRCPILGHINGVRTKPSVVDEGTYRRELGDK
ncbi:MAG: hypothetical protein KC587_17510 [Nitrospira sp.]|nr:hypothetical protein [Nitrospira sp.]